MPRVTSKQASVARKSWQERSEVWRERLSGSRAIETLIKAAEGTLEISPTRLKACTTILDRLLPTLSASEITRRDETATPEQMLERVKKLLGEEAYNKAKESYIPVGDRPEISEEPDGSVRH